MPGRERRRAGRGWNTDVETKTELGVRENAMHTA